MITTARKYWWKLLFGSLLNPAHLAVRITYQGSFARYLFKDGSVLERTPNLRYRVVSK